MEYFSKPFRGSLKFNWNLGLFLILLLGIPRFITVLHANKTGDYRFTSIIFILMWLLPFLFLNKTGRKAIGIRKPGSWAGVFMGILVGGGYCILVWLIGDLLYGSSINNWLVYISKSYSIPENLNWDNERFTFFLIFGITSMIFSPIGEEFMYRGFIHRCFSDLFGDNRASYVDSAAFAITHLAHFGILFVENSWEFHFLPALFWVILMFFASRIFFVVKQKSGSILGAILSHACFNLVMTYFIFYHVL